MQTIENYIQTYNYLHENWNQKIKDKQTIMLLASMYTERGHPLELNKLFDIAETIKKKAGIFALIRSNTRYIIAGVFDQTFTNPTEQIGPFFDTYKQLLKHGFKHDIHTYLAAGMILTNKAPCPEDTNAMMTKAHAIYQHIHQKNRFFPAYQDYPVILMQAMMDDSADEICKQTKDIYEKLKQIDLHKGNHLQTLSHVLTLDGQKMSNEHVQSVATIKQQLEQTGLKIKKTYYPFIGLLALLPQEQWHSRELYDLYDQLNQTKSHRWQKDMNLMLAIQLYMVHKSHTLPYGQSVLYTAITEILIHVQQLAMDTTTSGAVTAIATGIY